MSIEHDVLDKHQREAARAKYAADQSETNFKNCLDHAFRDGSAMRTRMDKHVADKGSKSLIDSIKDANSRKTGWAREKMPGSLFSQDGWRHGASAQRDNARRARNGLPEIAENFYRDDVRAKNARQTYDAALAKQTQSPVSGQAPTDKPKSIAADHSRAPRVSGHVPERSPQVAQPAPAKVNDNRSAAEADRIREGMADRRAQEKKREQGQGR